MATALGCGCRAEVLCSPHPSWHKPLQHHNGPSSSRQVREMTRAEWQSWGPHTSKLCQHG